MQTVSIDGFRQVVVHPALQAAFPITRHGIRRHRDDRHAGFDTRFLFPSTHDTGRLVAIDTRHLAIHEHQIVGSGTDLLYRLGAIGRRIHLKAELIQQVKEYCQIHRIVFRDQNPTLISHASLGTGYRLFPNRKPRRLLQPQQLLLEKHLLGYVIVPPGLLGRGLTDAKKMVQCLLDVLVATFSAEYLYIALRILWQLNLNPIADQQDLQVVHLGQATQLLDKSDHIAIQRADVDNDGLVGPGKPEMRR